MIDGWQYFLILFAALWAWFFAEEEWKEKMKLKYKKTLENIERLEKWHGENP